MYACLCVLTEGVTSLEPVFWGPVVVDFAVIGRGDNPTLGASDLELKGRDWEMVKRREDGQYE